MAVTARCAVFAKSELTHYANQGEPHGKLFRGQFESVAANLHGLFDKVKVDGPTVVVGHGALIAPIVEAFARLAGGDVSVPPRRAFSRRSGALAFAAGQRVAGRRSLAGRPRGACAAAAGPHRQPARPAAEGRARW